MNKRSTMNVAFCRSAKLAALLCTYFVFAPMSVAQICVDDDGDGWGWNPETNSSCQVTDAGEDGERDLIDAGGIKVSWPANSASENVSEYEAVGQINGGTETGYYRGSATEFSVRFSDISANYTDTICVRVRAVRNSNTGGTTTQTTSDWSSQSCITIPEAPLRPPTMIELSLIE